MSEVTMQELELETAELLPARETLNCYRGHGGNTTYTSYFQSDNGNGGNDDGNGSILGGWFDGAFSGNTLF
jgi:hypothetical protein